MQTLNNSRQYKILGAKLIEKDAVLFENFCAARGESVSSALRRLIFTELASHSFLDDTRKKALGVK